MGTSAVGSGIGTVHAPRAALASSAEAADTSASSATVGCLVLAPVTPVRVRPSKELALCTACLSRRSERGLATICRRSGRGRE
jgi:hypothetical protein